MTKKFNQMFYESKSWKKIMTFEQVELTPELAEDLLTLNQKEATATQEAYHNRRKRKKTLGSYSEEVKAGEWLYTGDTIKISREGTLLDGQHRCTSVIAAGKSMIVDIKTGLDPAIFKVLDSGAPRTISDVAHMAGYKYSSNITPLVKYIEAYTKKQSLLASTKERTRRTTVLDTLGEYDKDLLEYACRYGMVTYQYWKLVPHTLLSLLYYMAAPHHQEKLEEFGHLLTKGDGLGSTVHSSIWLLRNRMTENAVSSVKLSTNATAFLLFTVWNAFLQSKSMKRLPKPIENYPDILV